MASSSSNLVNNPSEGIHRIKYKFGHDGKKCETSRIRYKYCNYFLEYTNFKVDLSEYNCLRCKKKKKKKNYQHKFDEKLKGRFFSNIQIF